MQELLEQASMDKLAATRKETIMAGLRGALGKAKDTAKGKKWTGAEKHLGDMNALKANKNIKVNTKGAEKAVETAKSERIAQGKKVGAGLAAAGGIAMLAKALKRGGKSAVMSKSKKDKLLAALRKHRKPLTIGAGVAGTAGLASMLKN